jgi:hypothetical protein
MLVEARVVDYVRDETPTELSCPDSECAETGSTSSVAAGLRRLRARPIRRSGSWREAAVPNVRPHPESHSTLSTFSRSL